MADYVFHASVCVAWCFEDETTERVKNLFFRLSNDDRLLVPAHWPVEISNTFLQAQRRKRVTSTQVEGFWDQLARLRFCRRTAAQRIAGKGCSSFEREAFANCLRWSLSRTRHAKSDTACDPRHTARGCGEEGTSHTFVEKRINRRIRRWWLPCRAGCRCWRRLRCRDWCFSRGTWLRRRGAADRP